METVTTKARRWEHACLLGMARRPVWLVPGERGREASSWGGFVGHCKNFGFYSELGSICFDRITIAMVLRRDFGEARQNLRNWSE